MNAKKGDNLTPKAKAKLRKTFRFMKHILVDAESCTVQPKNPENQRGQWGCIDCGEMLLNNLGADMHTKSHRLAWWTGTYFEEP